HLLSIALKKSSSALRLWGFFCALFGFVFWGFCASFGFEFLGSLCLDGSLGDGDFCVLGWR
ncbi:hypothetical protein, partial [Anaerobiospirillum succiniciproducens]|uniref:hypothetical protein n=1 Tax=Anaerobiospirillum succiniciproducens TaxID=13335 RepID=UPI00248F4449